MLATRRADGGVPRPARTSRCRSSKLLSLIFFGLPDIEQNLKLDPPLAQRVSMKYRSRPPRTRTAPRRTSSTGCAGRAPRACRSRPAPVQSVHRFSSGTPRVINTFCDNALFEGYVARVPMIDEQMIERVARDLGLDGASPAIRRRPKQARLRSRHPPRPRRASRSDLGEINRYLAGLAKAELTRAEPHPRRRRPRRRRGLRRQRWPSCARTSSPTTSAPTRSPPSRRPPRPGSRSSRCSVQPEQGKLTIEGLARSAIPGGRDRPEGRARLRPGEGRARSCRRSGWSGWSSTIRGCGSRSTGPASRPPRAAMPAQIVLDRFEFGRVKVRKASVEVRSRGRTWWFPGRRLADKGSGSRLSVGALDARRVAWSCRAAPSDSSPRAPPQRRPARQRQRRPAAGGRDRHRRLRVHERESCENLCDPQLDVAANVRVDDLEAAARAPDPGHAAASEGRRLRPTRPSPRARRSAPERRSAPARRWRSDSFFPGDARAALRPDAFAGEASTAWRCPSGADR